MADFDVDVLAPDQPERERRRPTDAATWLPAAPATPRVKSTAVPNEAYAGTSGLWVTTLPPVTRVADRAGLEPAGVEKGLRIGL